MKFRIGILVAIAALGSNRTALAQVDTSWIPRIERTGSFLYSESTEPHTTYRGAEYESNTYTWAIQPGVGVFLVECLEIEMDIQYRRTRTEHPDNDYTSSSNLIVSLGPGYNLHLGPRAWAFVQLKVGLFWTANGYGTGLDGSPKWSDNQFVFPIVQGGFKFFVSSRSALIVQLQYDRLTETRIRTITLGMGLATYF